MQGRFPILYIAEKDPSEALMSCGVLAYLVEAMPTATFVVVGSRDSAPLFADTPRLTRLITMQGEGRFDWIGLWNDVRRTRWGLVVDQRGSALSGKLKRQRRAVRGPQEPGLHAVAQAARVLQLDDIPAPRLFLSEQTQSAADARIPAGEGPLLAMAPGHPWMGGRWPAEHYGKAAAALLTEGGPLARGRLMLVGSAIDRDIVNTIRASAPRGRLIELQGKLDVLPTAAAIRRAELYIGPDSVWTQLAVATGVPVVAMFGPTDDRLRGPWGGTTVRGPRSVAEYRRIDPRGDQALPHLNDVPWDRVVKAARTMLASTT